MKHLIILFFAINFQALASIQSDKMINTPLWEAPQVPSLQFSIRPSFDFKDRCDSFKSTVKHYIETQDISYISVSSYDQSRLAPMEYSFPKDTFATFELTINPSNGQLSYEVSTKKMNSHALPYYSQNQSIQYLSLQDISQAHYEIKTNEKSLTALSHKLGLEEPYLEISYSSRNGFSITSLSKDVACDLLDGNAYIEFKVQSEVSLTKNNYENLKRFYQQDLLPELSSVLKKESLNLKNQAYLLGYKVGSLLEKEMQTQDHQIVINSLSQVMDKLFETDSLTPTFPLFKNKNEYGLRVMESMKVDTQVLIGVK